MPKYVALLRGIAPTNPNMRNEKLRGVLQDLGFSNVQSVISSGNILFESPSKDVPGLESTIESAWPKKLGFVSTTIVRSLDDLKDLQAKDPFKGYDHGPKTSLNVTFLKHTPGKDVKISQDAGYTLPAIYPQEVCSIIDTTATKTPDYMAKAEKLYGKQITTRSWKTVLRIIDKLDAGANTAKPKGKYSTASEFLADLNPDQKEQVELLRSIITTAHPGLAEHIKWNAPSYVLNGEDRITFNVLNKEGAVKLVLHMGATRKENKNAAPIMSDDKGMIDWKSDTRGVVTFADLDDIKARQADIAKLITRWLAIK